MRLQLWSYNYDPEPTGIAPLSTVWARAMRDRGHDVSVVAAHPHYPEKRWGTRVKPYREVRDGVPVLRLPLWIGRDSTFARLRQEATFTAALTAALPALGRPDAIVAVSPSFPALVPAMAFARLRGIPWLLWLQDVLPDAAAATDILEEGTMLRAARGLERTAYRRASRVVVISDSFKDNLRAKGVPEDKMVRVYNMASRPVLDRPRTGEREPNLVLNMGNIGHTQNLAAIVSAFERDADLAELGARLVMAGDGVAGDEVRATISTDRVSVTGLVKSDAPGADELERYLQSAEVALVSQQYDGVDFNVPSKLMNFMGYGIPVVAAVRPESEVARLVEAAGAGWVTDSPESCAATLAQVLRDPAERERRGEAGRAFAQRHFTAAVSAEAFERSLTDVTGRSAGAGRP